MKSCLCEVLTSSSTTYYTYIPKPIHSALIYKMILISYMWIALFTTAPFVVNNVKSANILCLMGTPSPSHHIWNRSIMKALADRGNNLTILTVEKEASSENMHYIQMENVYEQINDQFLDVLPSTDGSIAIKSKNVFESITEMYGFFSFVDTHLVKTMGAKQLLNYPIDFKFDLVIHDFTSAQCLLGFVHHFAYPPLVSISAFSMPTFTYALAGTINFPSYVPHIAGTYSAHMTFIERAKNLSYFFYDWIYRSFVYMTNENRKAKRLFGGTLPKLQQIEQNTDLVLVNLDFSIDSPQLLPPNVIPVGGLQVKRVEPMDMVCNILFCMSSFNLDFFFLVEITRIS